MMSRWLAARKKQVVGWLRQGISPQRLALTIALGFAIGCIPLVGIPTPLCALLALALRLNLPAIQTANYAAMPLQIVLVFPFIRLGGWLFTSEHRPALTAGALLHGSPLKLLWASGGLAEQAMLAWVVIAVPAVALMTLSLTALLRRVPAVAEAGD